MLWDTAGQEEFDAITKAYYRGKIIIINKTQVLWVTEFPGNWKRIKKTPFVYRFYDLLATMR